MAQKVILARMGEIALKGLNRGRFEDQLKNNLRYRLKAFGKLSITQSQSRIWIAAKEEGNEYFEDDDKALEIMKAVTQVFGIVSCSLAWRFEGDMDSIISNRKECWFATYFFYSKFIAKT